MRSLFAALSLTVMTVPAAAQGCIPFDLGIAAIRADPDYRSHAVAKGGEIAAAAEVFNTAPPPTDYPWTTAVLVTFVNGGGAVVVGFDGLLCASIVVDGGHWPAVRQRIVGLEG